MNDLTWALGVLWAVTITATWKLCVGPGLRELLGDLRRRNRRTHRLAGLLSISPQFWRGPRQLDATRNATGSTPGLSARSELGSGQV